MTTWTQKETNLLLKLKIQHPGVPMKKFLHHFNNKTVNALRHKWDEINPEFTKGEWDRQEKQQLVDKIFRVISDNIQTISEALDKKRQRKVIFKEIYEIKQIVLREYLQEEIHETDDTEFLAETHGSKASKKSQYKKQKLNNARDSIDNPLQINNKMKKRDAKEESKIELKDDTEDLDRPESEDLSDLPQGLSRHEFLTLMNSLHPYMSRCVEGFS